MQGVDYCGTSSTVNGAMKRDPMTAQWHRQLYVAGWLTDDVLQVAEAAHRKVVSNCNSKRGHSRIFVNQQGQVIVVPSVRPEYEGFLTAPGSFLGQYTAASTLEVILDNLVEERVAWG